MVKRKKKKGFTTSCSKNIWNFLDFSGKDFPRIEWIRRRARRRSRKRRRVWDLLEERNWQFKFAFCDCWTFWWKQKKKRKDRIFTKNSNWLEGKGWFFSLKKITNLSSLHFVNNLFVYLPIFRVLTHTWAFFVYLLSIDPVFVI